MVSCRLSIYRRCVVSINLVVVLKIKYCLLKNDYEARFCINVVILDLECSTAQIIRPKLGLLKQLPRNSATLRYLKTERIDKQLIPLKWQKEGEPKFSRGRNLKIQGETDYEKNKVIAKSANEKLDTLKRLLKLGRWLRPEYQTRKSKSNIGSEGEDHTTHSQNVGLDYQSFIIMLKVMKVKDTRSGWEWNILKLYI